MAQKLKRQNMTGNDINREKLDFTNFWKVRSASSFMHLMLLKTKSGCLQKYLLLHDLKFNAGTF